METPEAILQTYWGYESFRPLQREIIEAAINGSDVLALLPTGGGKSLCFQVPALAREGVCVVVSPLVALMKDQVENLRKRGIRAEALFVGMSYRQIDYALDNCIHGETKFLYLSPERLRTELFIERSKQMKISMIAVDEAHCISEWGFDFRPPYRQISEFKERFPNVPVMALTATATERVQADIIAQLQLRNVQVFQQSFARANLSYSLNSTENKENRVVEILSKVPGSAIVYVKSRRRCEYLAGLLTRQRISATFYHAGVAVQLRHARQAAWLAGQTRVMVATNAFGMGIDKPDVRLVIHADVPDTLEAYYQEAGRAGRDTAKAYAVLLAGPSDGAELIRQVEQSYPEPDLIQKVYQALANYFKLATGAGEGEAFDFDLPDFQTIFGFRTNEVYYSLKALELEGFIQLNDAHHSPSKLHILLGNKELYDFQVRNEQYDRFIKLLLRMYGGALFTEYLIVSENQIAQHFLVPEADIRTMLTHLESLGVVVYEPQKDKPQLLYLTPRYDANDLPLRTEDRRTRYENAIAKAQAMGAYIIQNRRCRTLQLLDYFGEKGTPPCGVCDVCLERKRASKEDSSLKREVLVFIENQQNVSISKVVLAFGNHHENAVLSLVRELLTEEKIQTDATGILSLVK